MSWLYGTGPEKCHECPAEMELIIVPRTVDIGGFEVHRALPFQEKRMVGPFIFWDQMGPGEFVTGRGVDVRPHPHIGLSTVTYLFDGNMDHKDSLGNDMRIVPGDVNLMSAGRGIVHSERTGQDIRQNPSRLFGIQSWLAQPKAFEDSEPEFSHVGVAEIPKFADKEISGHLILGEFQGFQSPLKTHWETIYLELKMKKRANIEIPNTIEERAIFLVKGNIEIGGTKYNSRQMMVLCPGSQVHVKACEDVHLILLGGAAMDGHRYIWWNFVSSSVGRIKSAAADWSSKKFPIVPGDEQEFIPLPDLPFPKGE
jgi:redox-sensitive bicupin YhaK (pirin superfamily)